MSSEYDECTKVTPLKVRTSIDKIGHQSLRSRRYLLGKYNSPQQPYTVCHHRITSYNISIIVYNSISPLSIDESLEQVITYITYSIALQSPNLWKHLNKFILYIEIIDTPTHICSTASEQKISARHWRFIRHNSHDES